MHFQSSFYLCIGVRRLHQAILSKGFMTDGVQGGFVSLALIKQSNLIGDFSIKQFICDLRIQQINN